MSAKRVHMSPPEMMAHVFSLSLAFRIHLDLRPDLARDYAVSMSDCPCGCGQSAVIARIITDDTGYAVVLHELGHCCSPWGNLRESVRAQPPKPGCHSRDRHRWIDLKLEEERAAWDWARHYALYWSVAMEQTEQFAYQSYLTEKAKTR